jgi:hypothetical protein
MEELLKFLNLNSYQEVDRLIKAIQIKTENGNHTCNLNNADRCYLLYILILSNVQTSYITDFEVLIEYKLDKHMNIDGLKKGYLDLYNFIVNNQESGFIIIQNPDNKITDYLSKMKRKASCLA